MSPALAVEPSGLGRHLPRLRERLRVAVIYNGDKSAPGAVINETSNPRSLKSYRPVAEDIADGLRRAGFREVHLVSDDMTLGERLRDLGIHLAWINSTGVQGYAAAGHTPAMLEMFGIPYVGHGPLDAAILDNKHMFKRCALSRGIATAPFAVWDPVQDPEKHRDPAFWSAAFGDWRGPFVVKPVCGRASQNVHHVERVDELPAMVERVWAQTCNLVLVETYLAGPEYTVSVAGPMAWRDGRLADGGTPTVLSPVERVFTPGEKIFTSMDVRPITTDRARLLSPEAEPELHEAVAEMGRRIFRAFHLRALIRVDLRADAGNVLHVLEVNPKPDLTRPRGNRVSLASMGLARAGMSYEDLLVSLLLDRIHFYLAHRPRAVRALAGLLD